MMFVDDEQMKRITPATRTVSTCCKAPVTPCTPDDFNKLDINNKKSLIMTLQFICNQCGQYCKVEEHEINE